VKVLGLALLIVALSGDLVAVKAQEGSAQQPAPAGGGVSAPNQHGSSSASLPDTPQPQEPKQSSPQSPARSRDSKVSASGKIPAILAPQITEDRLTVHDKFTLYSHQAANPVALLLPVFATGIAIAHPPARYPHEWKDGGGAFGRLYGDYLARRESAQAAQFLSEVAFREDPRYEPSRSHSVAARISNALLFTLIDKSDSNHRMPAFSNFAGAAASGFVASAYVPNGYNDVVHAEHRAALGLAGFAAGNLVNEFCPQWGPLVSKLHLPFIHPPCAERIGSKFKD
jgi:hypothetical protein